MDKPNRCVTADEIYIVLIRFKKLNQRSSSAPAGYSVVGAFTWIAMLFIPLTDTWALRIRVSDKVAESEWLGTREVLQLCRSALISWADMVLAPSVAGLFKWRQFEPEMILLAVGWYLRFSLSYRDVEELLAERGLLVDHVTVWRWVQRYAPEIQRRLRPQLRPTNDCWRVDETYIRVKGKWVYLYRAVDSSGATIDFLLSAKRSAAAAERFLVKTLRGENHPAPRVINTDEHAGCPAAIVRLKAEEALEENCRHRPVQYLK
jgi:IS6 family transposase